jgi:sugar lactone lactonase YvrE
MVLCLTIFIQPVLSQTESSEPDLPSADAEIDTNSESNESVPNKSTLELVYEDNSQRLTGVAISKEGRLFVCYPRWGKDHKYDVVEILSDGTAKPYPNQDWNSWNSGEDGKNKWVCAQALYIDDQNFLWVVDPASPEFEGVYKDSNKLVKIDLSNDQIVKIYNFTDVAGPNSYLNDVRVDTEKQIAYLTNSQEGGIIVVDLKKERARQVLQNHYSVKSDPKYILRVEDKELKDADGKPVQMHSDGIALSPDRKWLYYKPLSDDKLYRIETAFLLDESLKASDLAAKVEDLGKFCTTDGMIFDQEGNLYLGDLERQAIVKLSPGKNLEMVVQDPRLIWPDSYAISQDGYLYITTSEIQYMPRFNQGVEGHPKPFAVYRIKL